MLKFIPSLIVLGTLSAANATPILFSDTVATPGIYLSNSGTDTYTFTHDILDNGFNSGTDPIQSADIYIHLADDHDNPAERVRIKLDDLIATHSMDVNYSTYHFNVNAASLQSDGKLLVSLNVLAGDFYFLDSRLDVTADRSAAPVPTEAVPEPTTLAMMGVGLLGMLLAARRRKA